MKEKMMKLFAFVLCAIFVSMNCAAPAAALEKEVAPGIQSEERKDVAPHGQYIPYYTPNPPAGSSSSDYKAYVGSTSGNVSLDAYVADKTMERLIKIVAPTFGATYSDFARRDLELLFSGLQTAIEKYAPDGGDMEYKKLTYKNEKISTSTSVYYKHVVTYTLRGGQTKQVTIYETASWV